MDRTCLHREIRNALSAADELSRHEHYLGDDELAGATAALRTALADLERDVGRSHAGLRQPNSEVVASFARAHEALARQRRQVPAALRSRIRRLLASAERIGITLETPSERLPSKPVLGGLPLARVIPPDVHALLGYVHSALFFASTRLARTGRARGVGLLLSAGIGGTYALTDHRLGVAKVLPIEVHESLDYAGGLAAIVAPFALGYAKKDPVAAMMHVGLGLGTVLTSLFSDYRASRGVTWPRRSSGGPHAGVPKGERGVRVSEVQRPLEGLSSAPSDWEGVVGSEVDLEEPKPSF